MATANELFEARHYPGVVALVGDALEEEPDCVPLMLLRARAHIGLRRDLEAQADLRDIIRLDPQCGLAYRLLGELAARRDENESAAIFFREALRLDPDDREASDWLAIVECSVRPAAVANKLPAPAAAAGRFPSTRGPVQRARTANDGQPRSLSAPARSKRPGSQPSFAKGTHTPDDQDERPTHRYSGERDRLIGERDRLARGSTPPANQPTFVPPPAANQQTFAPQPMHPTVQLEAAALPPPPVRQATGSSPTLHPYVAPVPSLGEHRAMQPQPLANIEQRTIPGAQPIRRPLSQPQARAAMPELPGFGDYLVSTGILTRERLRAAQAYQRSMKVQLSTAIVTLGLATPQRIEWAAVAHQSQLGRER